ncbi:MAG: tetratricopeptide repeat protein [Betaproteobacteria bacterium]|nr:tetratricopeptide repeat protein [Betaproteobacteria bacterium]
MDHAIRLEPGEARGYQSRAAIYAALRDDDRAIPDYDEAIRIDPNYALAYMGRGDAYARTGNPALAINDYSEAIRVNPANPAAWFARGILHSRQADAQRAIEDFNEALLRRPDHGITLRNRALALRKIGQIDRAMADFRAAIKVDAKDTVSLNELAWILATSPLAEHRDGKRAVELSSIACDITGWNRPGLIDTHAAALAEAGNFEGAAKWQAVALAFADFAKVEGEGARARLQMYRERKPFRSIH